LPPAKKFNVSDTAPFRAGRFIPFFVVVFMLRGTFVPSGSGMGSSKVAAGKPEIAASSLFLPSNREI
jgi:hypothetical protein